MGTRQSTAKTFNSANFAAKTASISVDREKIGVKCINYLFRSQSIVQPSFFSFNVLNFVAMN